MISKVMRSIKGSYVPVISIKGPINNATTEKINQSLSKIDVRTSEALAVTVNSSGGLPVQSELIANKLRQFSRKNKLKLLTFARDLVSSGGYLVLAAGDEVYCDSSSIIGNIGISVDKLQFKGALQMLQVEKKELKSNDYLLGHVLSHFHEMTPQEREKVLEMSSRMHKSLVDLIKQARGSKLKSDAKIFDGSLFTASESQELGLVLDKKYPRVRIQFQKSDLMDRVFK